MRTYTVYIMSNFTDSTLYIGVTNDLLRRTQEHKASANDGFTKKYRLFKLVYFESTHDVSVAIEREKQLKGWLRSKKDALIDQLNPNRKDLYPELVGTDPSLRPLRLRSGQALRSG
jgi:putative endonuclease